MLALWLKHVLLSLQQAHHFLRNKTELGWGVTSSATVFSNKQVGVVEHLQDKTNRTVFSQSLLNTLITPEYNNT
jgi:hypothetical protein